MLGDLRFTVFVCVCEERGERVIPRAAVGYKWSQDSQRLLYRRFYDELTNLLSLYHRWEEPPWRGMWKNGWCKLCTFGRKDSFEGPHETGAMKRSSLKQGKNLAWREQKCEPNERVRSKGMSRNLGQG